MTAVEPGGGEIGLVIERLAAALGVGLDGGITSAMPRVEILELLASTAEALLVPAVCMTRDVQPDEVDEDPPDDAHGEFARTE